MTTNGSLRAGCSYRYIRYSTWSEKSTIKLIELFEDRTGHGFLEPKNAPALQYLLMPILLATTRPQAHLSRLRLHNTGDHAKC